MQLREVMTSDVITARADTEVVRVAQLMRDESVGSVVVCDSEGRAVAMVTDRDLAIRALAEERAPEEPVGRHATSPLITGDPEMELEDAAALMVRHRVRRLPVVDASGLVGIVTLDDITVRTGDVEAAQQMTREVVEAAVPGFFFHERG